MINDGQIRASIIESIKNKRHSLVVIVGSGFSGLGLGYELQQAGIHDFVILERASSLGGTWRDNHYPGCACDVPSHLYSFSFAPNSDWSRAFSPHTEIRAYLEDCADRFDLRKHIVFDRNVATSVWDEREQLWRVSTDQGEEWTANALVFASGGLSNPAFPQIPGIERFKGEQFHSARWNHNYDLRGKTVAAVGTGASAIQFVPAIQPEVKQLFVLQRTPAWVLPRYDHAFPRWMQKAFKYVPGLRWMYRQMIYWRLESYQIAFQYPKLMRLAAKLGKKQIYSAIKDPDLRKRLVPQYTPGCKRILLSDDYYPALAQSNVEVVTDPIASIGEHSVELASGRSLPVDAIIYGTGFAVHEHQRTIRVTGRNGADLATQWKSGAEAYLGTAVAGFPNLFFMTGPNTGLGHNSMIVMIEGQAQYIAKAIHKLQKHEYACVEAKPHIQEEYNAWLDRHDKNTVWHSGCVSWYLDENGKNTTLWPGLATAFRLRLARLKFSDFEWTKKIS